jgi:gamma-glutamyltranspeptidase
MAIKHYLRLLSKKMMSSNIHIGNYLKKNFNKWLDEFYKGETAKILVKYLQEKGAIITLEDLLNMKLNGELLLITRFKDNLNVSAAVEEFVWQKYLK